MKAGGTRYLMPQFWIRKQQSHHAVLLDSPGDKGWEEGESKKHPPHVGVWLAEAVLLPMPHWFEEEWLPMAMRKLYICTTFQHFLVQHLTPSKAQALLKPWIVGRGSWVSAEVSVLFEVTQQEPMGQVDRLPRPGGHQVGDRYSHKDGGARHDTLEGQGE